MRSQVQVLCRPFDTSHAEIASCDYPSKRRRLATPTCPRRSTLSSSTLSKCVREYRARNSCCIASFAPRTKGLVRGANNDNVFLERTLRTCLDGNDAAALLKTTEGWRTETPTRSKQSAPHVATAASAVHSGFAFVAFFCSIPATKSAVTARRQESPLSSLSRMHGSCAFRPPHQVAALGPVSSSSGHRFR